MSDRLFDVALFGATGFTGKLVAEYLAAHAPRDLRWCIAGRNREKLEAVRRALRIPDVSIRIADGHDQESLDALVPEARVVCSTVGPFAKHGVLLTRTAARAGTHYCDITGEPQFIRRSIDDNHEAATRSGARLVHCCGFDSIPFDLGVHMLWDHAKTSEGAGLRWAKGFLAKAKGGYSGGTIASMAALLDEASRDRDVRRLLVDPHGLDQARGSKTTDPFERDQRGVKWDADLERWTAPFLMAVVNTRIVRRSSALLEGGYGERFRYREAMSLMRGPKGFVAASAVTAALGVMTAALAFAPARRLVEEKLLKPGDGPSKEAREGGHFDVRLVAETERGTKIRGRVSGFSDPGYGETAKMLGESALCLALDGGRTPPVSGVLTPATAMGTVLIERLRAAGMTFRVDA